MSENNSSLEDLKKEIGEIESEFDGLRRKTNKTFEIGDIEFELDNNISKLENEDNPFLNREIELNKKEREIIRKQKEIIRKQKEIEEEKFKLEQKEKIIFEEIENITDSEKINALNILDRKIEELKFTKNQLESLNKKINIWENKEIKTQDAILGRNISLKEETNKILAELHNLEKHKIKLKEEINELDSEKKLYIEAIKQKTNDLRSLQKKISSSEEEYENNESKTDSIKKELLREQQNNLNEKKIIENQRHHLKNYEINLRKELEEKYKKEKESYEYFTKELEKELKTKMKEVISFKNNLEEKEDNLTRREERIIKKENYFDKINKTLKIKESELHELENVLKHKIFNDNFDKKIEFIIEELEQNLAKNNLQLAKANYKEAHNLYLNAPNEVKMKNSDKLKKIHQKILLLNSNKSL